MIHTLLSETEAGRVLRLEAKRFLQSRLLPDGADSGVLREVEEWLQSRPSAPEPGGYQLLDLNEVLSRPVSYPRVDRKRLGAEIDPFA